MVKVLGVLQNIRSEFGKQIRKKYESGKIKISRHNFLEHRIREDGVTNTLSTVLKDNYLALKIKEGEEKINMNNVLNGNTNEGIFIEITPELTVYAIYYPPKDCYIAIRKLTPKECFRLQGFTDDYFKKAEFVNFDSQLYKQAGNAMTVDVVQTVGDAIIKFEESE